MAANIPQFQADFTEEQFRIVQQMHDNMQFVSKWADDEVRPSHDPEAMFSEGTSPLGELCPTTIPSVLDDSRCDSIVGASLCPETIPSKIETSDAITSAVELPSKNEVVEVEIAPPPIVVTKDVYDIPADSELYGLPIIQPFMTAAMIDNCCKNEDIANMTKPGKAGGHSSNWTADMPIIAFLVPGAVGCQTASIYVNRIMEILTRGVYNRETDKLAVWTPKKLTGCGAVQCVKVFFRSSSKTADKTAFDRRDRAMKVLREWMRSYKGSK
eukprot:PhF_6_TR14081/c1_g1_i2/m.22493